MEAPHIRQAALHGYSEPERIVGECACCGQEIHEGEEVKRFPSTSHYFCSGDCVIEQMEAEGNLERVVVE